MGGLRVGDGVPVGGGGGGRLPDAVPFSTTVGLGTGTATVGLGVAAFVAAGLVGEGVVGVAMGE